MNPTLDENWLLPGGGVRSSPVVAAEGVAASTLSHRPGFQAVQAGLTRSTTFLEFLPACEPEVLELLAAERLTVYGSSGDGKSLFSKYWGGSDLQGIRLSATSTSIAGFVAANQKPLLINDVNDPAELERIHPRLKFDDSFDQRSGFRSRGMIGVPIQVGAQMVGVIQVINKVGDLAFNDEDLQAAYHLAERVGDVYRIEFEGSDGPYDYLVRMGRLTPSELDRYQRRAKTEQVSMTYLLTREHRIPWQMVATSLESCHRIPFMRFDPTIKPSRKLTERFNRNYLLRQRFIPFDGEIEKEIVILIDDPGDGSRWAEIQKALPARRYIIRLGFEDDILRYLGVNSGVSATIYGIVDNLSKESSDLVEPIPDAGASGISDSDGAVIQLVNRLIIEADRAGASEIHVEPGKRVARVRFRIEGACRNALEFPAAHAQAVVSRLKVMSRLNHGERLKPQEGKIILKAGRKELTLHLATMPTHAGEAAVMRLLSPVAALPLTKLGISERIRKSLQANLDEGSGLLMVAGPPNAGKSITMGALLGRLNHSSSKVWLIEDPVELAMEGVSSYLVDPVNGLTVAGALRSLMRSDRTTEVFAVGVTRDQPTVQAMVEAALFGHLVLSTLRARSVVEAVDRLLKMVEDPVRLADALQGVLAQRLVRALCRDCKRSRVPTVTEWQLITRWYQGGPPEALPRREEARLSFPEGCSGCAHTGYRGRVGIHEVLVVTPRLRSCIASRPSPLALRECAAAEEPMTLLHDGIEKLLAGLVDPVAVLPIEAPWSPILPEVAPG